MCCPKSTGEGDPQSQTVAIGGPQVLVKEKNTVTSAHDQTGSYIPSTDAGFRDWVLNFSTLISADPTRYGLDSSDSAIIAQQNSDYQAAYQVVQSNATRTPAAIAQKDAIKASAIGSCRVYAQTVKVNQGVSNEDKSALGIHINDPTPTPIPVPETAPLLMVVNAFSGVHQIRYADENSPASRRKAHGAAALQLNRKVATGADANPQGSEFIGLFTKNPVLVEQNAGDAGKVATYFGRWVTRTGKLGPWGPAQAMTIAFGGPVQESVTVTGDGSPMVLPGSGEEQIRLAA